MQIQYAAYMQTQYVQFKIEVGAGTNLRVPPCDQIVPQNAHRLRLAEVESTLH
jgi:hypothetical protein